MLKNAFIELLSPPATKKNESIYKNNSQKNGHSFVWEHMTYVWPGEAFNYTSDTGNHKKNQN